jgi:hypothetical protein
VLYSDQKGAEDLTVSGGQVTVKNFPSSCLETTKEGDPMVSLPPDPQIRSALTTSSYKETSLFVFCRLRWSLMNQWSQDVSPSMLPFAPAVKPPDDAST